MCETTKPLTCEVPGCKNTYRVYKHKQTGVYACGGCRRRYSKRNTFEFYPKPKKPTICTKCNRATLPERMRSDGICAFCVRYYKKHGTYKRQRLFRPTIEHIKHVSVCGNCKTRLLKHEKNRVYRKGKWICQRCYEYFQDHGKHRPKHYDATNCVGCGQPLVRTAWGNHGGRGMCRTCYAYYRRHKKTRPTELINQYAPHGWCECGKPATKQIDLRTGALYVHPTKTGTSDVVRADVQEWAEWVCDKCAGFEAEMQHIDTSECRPGALIARE